MKNFSALAACALVMGVAHPAAANRVEGLLQGVFPGNDSELAVFDELGLVVVELARVDIPLLMNDGLVLTVTMENDDDDLIAGEWGTVTMDDDDDDLIAGVWDIVTVDDDDDEPIAGEWDFSGPEVVDLIVVKAGNNWAAYLYNDIITDNMPNLGLWNTSDLDDKGLSHLTAYHIVPEPGTGLLLGAVLFGLGLYRRRSAA